MDKKFVEAFEKGVKNTIEQYDLIDKDDKVFVACSGGKDSSTVLYLLNKFGYDVEGIIIDLLIGEWSKRNLANIKQFCKEHDIKLHVINIREEVGTSICYIRSGIQSKINLKNCTICGIIKRWLLNRKSRKLGATRLVTGHNLDDEAETFLMNLFHGDPKLCLRLGPKTGMIDDEKFVVRVKPLYFCTNKEVEKYSRLMEFPVLYDACPCSTGAFRGDVRDFIKVLEDKYPGTKSDIVNTFLQLITNINEHMKCSEKLKYCKNCGEPSKNDICKACELFSVLNNTKIKT